MPYQPAFGGILQQLVSLEALEFRPEPLDAIVKRRLKTIWDQTPCPECGTTAIRGAISTVSDAVAADL